MSEVITTNNTEGNEKVVSEKPLVLSEESRGRIRASIRRALEWQNIDDDAEEEPIIG